MRMFLTVLFIERENWEQSMFHSEGLVNYVTRKKEKAWVITEKDRKYLMTWKGRGLWEPFT